MAANTERQLVGFNLEEEKFGMDIMVEWYRPRLCVNSLAIKIIRAYPPNNK